MRLRPEDYARSLEKGLAPFHLFYGDETGMQRVADTIPARRMGTPEDIADACLFLASPMARWITGTNVMVHGGGEIPAYLGASTGEVTQVTKG